MTFIRSDIQTISKITISIALMLCLKSYANQADDFSKLSPKDAVIASHNWHRTGDARIQITSTEINASFKDGSETTIPLGNEFFVSIAPYIESTHNCGDHVPTSCTGEMQNKLMQMTIVDLSNNEVYKKQLIKTQEDGFFDIWLPRDKKYEITFSYNNLETKQQINTDMNAQTCITTMQLKPIGV